MNHRLCKRCNPIPWKGGKGEGKGWGLHGLFSKHQRDVKWLNIKNKKKLNHQEIATWTFHSKSAICLAPCVLRLPKHSAKPKWPVYYQQTHQTLISLDREISTIFTQPHINLYTKHLHWISGTSTDTTRPKKGCWMFQVTSAPTSSWPKSLTTCMKIHNKRVEFQNHWTCFLNKLVSYTNKYVSLFASRFFLFDSFEAESVWFAWSMQVLL